VRAKFEQNMASERDRDDEEHIEAFGWVISQRCRDAITQLGDNDPEVYDFTLNYFDMNALSDLALEQLGRFITDNDHLKRFTLGSPALTDARMSLLCRTMLRARSLNALRIHGGNNLGLNGIQSMVPFLKNSQNITNLTIGRLGENINSECFGLIVGALDGGQIEELILEDCNIDDITALEHCTLSSLKLLHIQENILEIIPSLEKYTNLETLLLRFNNIKKEGCRMISKLLENKSSSLDTLDLTSNDIDDEGAELLANSLQHNTTLVEFRLGGNEFKEQGRRAFLKLLNEASSIKTTHGSNHTLTTLRLPFTDCANWTGFTKHIDFAVKTNKKYYENIQAAGGAKIIATHLNSIVKNELCHLQEIDCSYSNVFAEIDPVLLPNILAITGEEHGQDELFRMLVASAPGLASVVNKEAAAKEKIAEKATKMTALDARMAAIDAERNALANEILQLKKKLVSNKSGDDNYRLAAARKACVCGKRRSR